MITNKVFVFIFAFTLICIANSSDLELRIFYGSEVSITDYPYFAETEWCGAVILSEKWLITAAHCVESPEAVIDKLVWVGGESRSNSMLVRYTHYFIHPDYDEDGNDIALLRMRRPHKFTSKIRNIKLAKHSSANNELVFIGRGMDETGYRSESLMQMDLVRLTLEQCMEALPAESRSNMRSFMEKVGDAVICAMRVGDKPGMCGGDSGSPLVRDGTLVGIASFIFSIDEGCNSTQLGFYTNVTSYIPWIRAVTGLDI